MVAAYSMVAIGNYASLLLCFDPGRDKRRPCRVKDSFCSKDTGGH